MIVQHLAVNGEYQSFPIDATMRCTLSILPGRTTTDPAPDDCKRRVLTARGRTGAVVAMEAMPREDVQTYIDVFRSTGPTSACNTVEYISTDNPSNLMWESMRCLTNLTLSVMTLLIRVLFATSL